LIDIFIFLQFRSPGVVPAGFGNFEPAFFPLRLACLGWPPKGLFFILDNKEPNNQGLDLMLD